MWSEVTSANQPVSVRVSPNRRSASSPLIDHSCPDSPGYIEVGRREEPNYSAHPGTTITIRVDQPVREYHGRLPRHEEHLVGVSAPVGGSVGETVREY